MRLKKIGMSWNVFDLSFIKAREAVEMRAQLEKKVAQREKEKQEDKLRKLAQKAREARAGIQSASGMRPFLISVSFI